MHLKILIAQPLYEKKLKQLEKELQGNSDLDIVMFPEGYVSSEQFIPAVQQLAFEHNTMIITSYRENNKDRALIIDKNGDVVLDRAKTLIDEPQLVAPVSVATSQGNIGYILCMEILKGITGFEPTHHNLSLIAHPIGVGMFSDEQFDEWVDCATKVAIKYQCYIIGTSHADGSYRNCGVSIPIAYCINPDGTPLLISRGDTTTRIIELSSEVTM